MNILIITLTYKPSLNGVAIYTSRLVKWLRKNGHSVWVIGPKVKNLHDPQYLSLPTIFDVPFVPSDYPVALPIITNKQMKNLATVKWDIIHVQHPSIFTKFAVSLGQKLSAPVVFTYHTHYEQYIQTFVNWLPEFTQKDIYEKQVLDVCNEVQAVFVNTPWIKDMLRHKITTPTYLSPTSGLEKLFYKPDSKVNSRKLLKLPEGKPIFLSVARLDKVKNIDFIIRAFAQWKKRHSGYLMLVGDGNERATLESLVKKLRLGSSVRFVGPIANTDISVWYNSADVFLFASTTDTLGISLIEALSAGLPVVAKKYPATESLIIPGKNGYLTKNTLNDYVKFMELAYANIQEMQPYSIETAKSYLLDKVMQELLNNYKSVISKYEK